MEVSVRIVGECSLAGLLGAAACAVEYMPRRPQLNSHCVSNTALAPGKSFRPSSLDAESTVPPQNMGMSM